MTNWLIIKSEKEVLKEKLSRATETLKATAADKEKLELDLNAEIKKFAGKTANATFFKEKYKKDAERLAGELTITQTSLKDANDKATNEKTALLAELKAINEKIGNNTGILPEELSQQIDAIKTRLNVILEAERGDVITVLEARQANFLKELQDKNLVLNDQEKKALDYAAGYYYWHSQGNHERAKQDKEELDKYLTDNKDTIKSEAVLFSVSVVSTHYSEEEKHTEDHHKYLKDLADLNNKYAELDQKYKDKEAELVDAQEKLTLTQEEKDKLSDRANKDITDLNNDIRQLGATYSENYKKFTDNRDKLVGQINNLKNQLKEKTIDAKKFGIEFWKLKKQVEQLEAEARLSTTEQIKKLSMNDGQLSNFGKDIWENLTKTLAELQSIQSKKRQKEIADRFSAWLSSFETEYKNIFDALGTTERERERAVLKARIEWAKAKIDDPALRQTWETEAKLKVWLSNFQQALLNLEQPETTAT